MKDALSSAIAGANVEPYTDSADFTASKSFSMPLYRKIFAVNYQKEFIEKETDPSVITRLVDEAWFVQDDFYFRWLENRLNEIENAA